MLSGASESPFAEMYAFEVPASISSATFVVDLDGHAPVTYAGQSYTLHFDHQQADFLVAFPRAKARFQGYLPTPKPKAKAHKPLTTRPLYVKIE